MSETHSRTRVLVATTILVVVAAALGVGRKALEPAPVKVRIEGVARGPVSRVVFASSSRDVQVVTTPAPDGRYSLDVPQDAIAGGRVQVESARGAATTSGQLAATTAPVVSLAPLELWSAGLEVKRDGERVRFSWGPLSKDKGEKLRYSVALGYESRQSGRKEHAEALLSARESDEVVETLEEIAAQLPDLDPEAKTCQATVSAFDAADRNGTTWAGDPLTWQIPPDLPRKKDQ